MAAEEGAPLGSGTKAKGGKAGSWVESHKPIVIGGGIVVLVILFIFLKKGSGSSSAAAAPAAGTGTSAIDPATGYPQGSAADMAALGQSNAQAGAGTTDPITGNVSGSVADLAALNALLGTGSATAATPTSGGGTTTTIAPASPTAGTTTTPSAGNKGYQSVTPGGQTLAQFAKAQGTTVAALQKIDPKVSAKYKSGVIPKGVGIYVPKGSK